MGWWVLGRTHPRGQRPGYEFWCGVPSFWGMPLAVQFCPPPQGFRAGLGGEDPSSPGVKKEPARNLHRRHRVHFVLNGELPPGPSFPFLHGFFAHRRLLGCLGSPLFRWLRGCWAMPSLRWVAPGSPGWLEDCLLRFVLMARTATAQFFFEALFYYYYWYR